MSRKRTLIAVCALTALTLLVILHVRRTSSFIQWTFESNRGGVTPPAVGGQGLVFVGVASTLYALNQNTGKTQWTAALKEYIRYPLVDRDNTVYAISELDGQPHTVTALDGSTGKIKWAKSIYSSVQYSREFLDSATGKPVWNVSPDSGNISSRYDQTRLTTKTGEMLFVSQAGKVLMARAAKDGAVEWKITAPQNADITAWQTSFDGNVYAQDGHNVIWALDGGTGTKKWMYSAHGSITSLEVGLKVYLGTSDNKVIALNKQSGREENQVSLGFNLNHFGYPEDPAIAATPTGSVYCASDTKLYSIRFP